MKKYFSILAALVVTTFAFSAKAQLSGIEGMPPYKLGITIGMNMPWMSGSSTIVVEESDIYGNKSNNSYSSNYTINIGIQIGSNLMIDASELIPNTFARIETKYSMKGGQSEITHANITMKEKITTHYIEIPVHYGYAWYINDNVSLMAETGPYVAFGFYGTDDMTKGDGTNSNLSVFGKVVGSNRFDLGWGVQGSAMFAKNFQAHVAFDYGFINLRNGFLQNRNLSVGFTWFFESLFE